MLSLLVCPIGRVAGLVVAGEGAQLQLIAISGGFKAPRSQCGIVTHLHGGTRQDNLKLEVSCGFGFFP